MSVDSELRKTKQRNRAMERAIAKRIAVVRDYRIRHGKEKFPEDVDLDALAPNTAQYVGGFDDDHLLRKMAKSKESQNGLLGVTYKQGRYRAMLLGNPCGTSYPTAVDAAEAFNEAARKRFGDRAVLCDIRAARRLEERMTG